MSLLAKKYNDRIVDAMLLEVTFDNCMLEGDLTGARKHLKQLTDITTKWIHNIVVLKQVLEERGYTTKIHSLNHYLAQFDDINTHAISRADYLLHYLEGKE